MALDEAAYTSDSKAVQDYAVCFVGRNLCW